MKAGTVGFVSQSGALGYGAVSLALARGLGLGRVVNTGNEADVGTSRCSTSLAGLTECTRPDRLHRVASRRRGAASPGRARQAGRAAQGRQLGGGRPGRRVAHRRAGDRDRVVDGVLRQLRIARARDVDELLDLGDAFEQPRRPAGPRVAVVTTSPAAPASWRPTPSTQHGLDARVARAGDRAALDEVVPAFGSTANPVDVTATVMSDPTLFDRCLDAVAATTASTPSSPASACSPATTWTRIVDSLTPGRRAHRQAGAGRAHRGGLPRTRGVRGAARSGLPPTRRPRRAVRALAALWTDAASRGRTR